MQKNVLIIEDDENNMELITFTLQNHGFQTIKAWTGQQGINQALTERPDFIILDIQRPDMDGGLQRLHRKTHRSGESHRANRGNSRQTSPATVRGYLMKYHGIFRSCGTGLLTGLILGACTWLPNIKAKADDPPVSPGVEMISGGLLISQSGYPELGLLLANNSPRTLWINVRFRTPDGFGDCLLAKELEPGTEHYYSCPQATIRADTDYPVHITVFTDLDQNHVLERLSTRFRFDREDVLTVQKARES